MASARVLWTCFLRSFFVGAGLNARGMQNIGLLFALWPGLSSIHTTPETRSLAYRRYASHYNCHAWWTPLLIGMFLNLETAHSRGIFSAEMLDRFRNTTIHTLSALGDSVFAGSIVVFWALSTAIFAVFGLIWAAIAWSALFLIGITAFKLYGFTLGWRTGLNALLHVKRWNLINRGDTIKYVNALLLAGLFFCLLEQGGLGNLWDRPGLFGPADLSALSIAVFAACAALFWGLTLLALRLHVPRFFASFLIFIVLALAIFFVYYAPANIR